MFSKGFDVGCAPRSPGLGQSGRPVDLVSPLAARAPDLVSPQLQAPPDLVSPEDPSRDLVSPLTTATPDLVSPEVQCFRMISRQEASRRHPEAPRSTQQRRFLGFIDQEAPRSTQKHPTTSFSRIYRQAGSAKAWGSSWEPAGALQLDNPPGKRTRTFG